MALAARMDSIFSNTSRISLKTYVVTVPSEMQKLLGDEVTSIPWAGIAQTFQVNQVPFDSLKNKLSDLVEVQGTWQAMAHEINRLQERIEGFLQGAEKETRESKALLLFIQDLATANPVLHLCIALAQFLDAACGQIPLDENTILHALENLSSQVQNEFKNADDQLRSACDLLEKLSDPLQKIIV